MAKSTSTGLSRENESDSLDDDMDLLDTDLTEGDDWDDSLDQEDVVKPKKKGGMFNFFIILLGVLIFVGIVYSKLASAPEGTGNASTPVIAEENPVQAPLSSSSTAPIETQATEVGPLTPMPDFAEASPTPQTVDPSHPAPISVQGSDIVLPVVTLTPNDPVSPIVETSLKEGEVPFVPVTGPAPDSALVPQKGPENIDHSKELSRVPVMPLADVQQAEVVSLTPNSKDLDGAAGDRIQAIETQLLDLSKKIDAQKSTILTSRDGEQTVRDSQEITLLAGQVKSLSDRLAMLEKNIKNAPEAGLGRSLTGEALSEDISDNAAFNESADHSDTMVSKPDIASARPVTKVHYILRAVSNGSAYVARSQSSPVIRVQVGDMVEGVGRVKDIRLTAPGRWIVMTTGGMISSQ